MENAASVVVWGATLVPVDNTSHYSLAPVIRGLSNPLPEHACSVTLNKSPKLWELGFCFL